MGKATLINQHDWIAVRASFADGVKANVTWNRGGSSVSVVPDDAKLSETLSLIVSQASTRSQEGADYKNIGDIAQRMEAAAKAAKDLPGYIYALKATLGVDGERPKPKNADNAPAQTTAALKPNRGGWLLNVAFQNGETLELKISRGSIGLLASPRIASRDDSIGRFVMGTKMSGAMDDETLAQALRDAAIDAPGIDEWFEASKAACAAGPKPR